MSAVNANCWASDVSPCEGGISGEHIISKSLFTSGVTLRGLDWCPDDFKTIGINSFTANILCRKHNSILSSCDSEAKRVHDVLQWVRGLGESGRNRSSRLERIDGLAFAKWMAKSACNLLSVTGRHIPNALIQYSFAVHDDLSIRVYFIAGVGDQFDPNDDHVGVGSFHDSQRPDDVLVSFLFRGMAWVIGTTDVTGAEQMIASSLGFTHISADGFHRRPGAMVFDSYEASGRPTGERNMVQFLWNETERAMLKTRSAPFPQNFPVSQTLPKK